MFTSKSGQDSDLELPKKPEEPKKAGFPDIEVKNDISTSVIGKGLTIVGNAFSEGEICIEGEFQGDIQCASLRVGERARVIGGLRAEDIIVSGRVEGEIHGERVTLEQSSQISGDIYHQSLAIAKGAVFHGKSYQAGEAKGDGSK